jgi:cytochrome P450
MSETTAQGQAAPAFNPMSPDFLRNPYPTFHQLRSNAPIFKTPLGFWLATRYDDVNAILKDRRFGKGFEARTIERYGAKAFEEPIFASMKHWMLVQDPPNHTRLRGLVAKAFTPRTIESWRPRTERLVEELIDRIIDRRRMDFINDFAYPLPINVICDMLGIPPEDRVQFTRGAETAGRVLDPTPMSRQDLDVTNEGFQEQEAYFRDLFRRKRERPGDDLTSLLVQVEDEGDRLSEVELAGNIYLLFAAGHETTVNLLGNGMFALLNNPDQWARLKADPSLIPGAVEEMLRFDSSVQMTGRTAYEDLDIGGTELKAGETVICLLGAANRDPEEFEDPDAFRVDRPDVKPTSFGGGIHICLGAQLARMEGEVAFRALIKRMPDIHLDEGAAPDWRQTFALRGLTELPVAW